MSDNINFNELFKEIAKNNKNLKNPLELLVGLANGYDLSSSSLAYNFARKLIEENGYDLPDEYEYLHLLELIVDVGANETIGVKEMLQAQKTLVEYQHPKRKSVEVTNLSDTKAISELNEKEVKTFWEKFNGRY